jgi:hypothetical protein
MLQSKEFCSFGLPSHKSLKNVVLFLEWLGLRGIAVARLKIDTTAVYQAALCDWSPSLDRVKFHRLESLIIDSNRMDLSKMVSKITSQAKKIRVLRFISCSWLTYPRLRRLVKQYSNTLEELQLTGIRHIDDLHMTKLVMHLKKVYSLTIGRFDLTRPLLQAVHRNCRLLRSVDFSNCTVHAESLIALLASFSEPPLIAAVARGGLGDARRFDQSSFLHRNAGSTAEAAVVGVGNTGVGDTRLQSLTFNNSVTPDLLSISQCIAESCGTALQTLSIVGDYGPYSTLLDPMAVTIANACTHLVHVTFSENLNLTDVAFVAVVTQCAKLRYFCASACPGVTEVTTAAIATHCLLLEELDLKWCDNITMSTLTLFSAPAAISLRRTLRKLNVFKCRYIQLTPNEKTNFIGSFRYLKADSFLVQTEN